MTTREEKRKGLSSAMSDKAFVMTLPRMTTYPSAFLKKHKENKARFKKEIQFKVRNKNGSNN